MALFLLFVVQITIGQSNKEQMIEAIISVNAIALENVNIINSRTEVATRSNKDGFFKINVKLDDALVLTAVNLVSRTKIITDDDLKLKVIELKMTVSTTQLKEVIVVTNEGLTEENQRIVPHGQRKFTPAERKLYTANSGLLDPLLNKISGRLSMLKKEIVVERNEKLLLNIDRLYLDNYYTEVLKIPQNYIKGFQYFLLDDVEFIKALQSKNKTMTLFLVKKLAVAYNEIVKIEEK